MEESVKHESFDKGVNNETGATHVYGAPGLEEQLAHPRQPQPELQQSAGRHTRWRRPEVPEEQLQQQGEASTEEPGSSVRLAGGGTFSGGEPSEPDEVPPHPASQLRDVDAQLMSELEYVCRDVHIFLPVGTTFEQGRTVLKRHTAAIETLKSRVDELGVLDQKSICRSDVQFGGSNHLLWYGCP